MQCGAGPVHRHRLPDPADGRAVHPARDRRLAPVLLPAQRPHRAQRHPLGKACDAPPGSYGTLPTAAQKAAGDALAASLQASAARTGVHYLIWYGRIWNADRAHEGWRPYRGAGVYNTTPTTSDGITGGHYDHVHISVYCKAEPRRSAAGGQAGTEGICWVHGDDPSPDPG